MFLRVEVVDRKVGSVEAFLMIEWSGSFGFLVKIFDFIFGSPVPRPNLPKLAWMKFSINGKFL